MADGGRRSGSDDNGSLGTGMAALAVAVLAALWRRRRRHHPAPHRLPHLPPAAEARAVRLVDALVELSPVVAVFVLACTLFGLGWVLPDLWYVGLVVLMIAGIGFVVWCTRVIPWPRE